MTSSIFTPPESDQEPAPPSAVELLWENHRGTLLGGVGVVALLIVIVLGVIVSNRASRIASETLFSAANNEEGWREVISKYPRMPVASDAMLMLAASLRDAGKIDESNALYSRFTESFPLDPLAVSGLLGRASNARMTGHPDQALNSYQQASAAYPGSYGAPFALFSQARLLVQQGNMEEAKRVIQTLGSQYPYSVAAQAAGAVQRPQAQN